MLRLSRRARKTSHIRRSFTSALVIGLLACQISPMEGEAAGKRARKMVGSSINTVRETLKPSRKKAQTVQSLPDDPSQLGSRVTHVRLCPRRLLLYVGEQFTLVPLPLDAKKEVVHGVGFAWQSTDSTVADAASDGSITALKSGSCTVTASVGNKKDKVSIDVRDGRRPLLTNSQWDIEHPHDCDDPEQSAADANSTGEVITSAASGSRKGVVTPEVVVDPDDPSNVGAGGSTVNAAGNMRFTPAEVPQGAVGKAKNQLGSSNFGMSIPIFDSPGRGISASVALAYNSRTWTKDGNKMVFDYEQGWPSAGFRLNYGRIIPNYDAPVGFPSAITC